MKNKNIHERERLKQRELWTEIDAHTKNKKATIKTLKKKKIL